jgi:hypothetical protein
VHSCRWSLELGIAKIEVFLQATFERAAKVEIRARRLQDGGIFAKVEFVRYCVEYLYSSVTMRLKLYLTIYRVESVHTL